MRFGILLKGLALASLAALVTVSAIAAGKAPKTGPARVDLAEIGGVWRSRGYGWIWSAEGGEIAMFDESGGLCLPSDDAGPNPDDRDTRIRTGDGGRTLSVSVGDDQYRYRFDRIDALPEACRAAPPSDPPAVFDAAVETLTSHYAFFQARKIDWQKAVQAERASVTRKTSDKELFQSLSRLLSHFPDSHVSLDASIGDSDLDFDPTDAVAYRMRGPGAPEGPGAAKAEPGAYWAPKAAAELIDGRERSGADGEIAYGLIDDVGYLKIATMSGYSDSAADRVMAKAMALFEGARAVIVDVSMNEGGYDQTALRLAGRFAAERAVGYSKYAGDGPAGDPPQPIYVEPSEGPRYLGPVFLVTSRKTVSAAEVFVLAMRALPNVVQIGEATDGSLSDILSKPLPNGWSLRLSNEVYLDAGGKLWEGAGIPPQMEVGISWSDRSRDVDATRRLIEQLLAEAPHAAAKGAAADDAAPASQ